MIVTEHKSIGGRTVVAVCDDNLIGRRIEDEKRQIDLSSDFYKGEKKTKEEVLKIFERADIINLVGKESVGLAVDAKIISKNWIIKIKGVPHAQAVLR